MLLVSTLLMNIFIISYILCEFLSVLISTNYSGKYKIHLKYIYYMSIIFCFNFLFFFFLSAIDYFCNLNFLFAFRFKTINQNHKKKKSKFEWFLWYNTANMYTKRFCETTFNNIIDASPSKPRLVCKNSFRFFFYKFYLFNVLLCKKKTELLLILPTLNGCSRQLVKSNFINIYLI